MHSILVIYKRVFDWLIPSSSISVIPLNSSVENDDTSEVSNPYLLLASFALEACIANLITGLSVALTEYSSYFLSPITVLLPLTLSLPLRRTSWLAKTSGHVLRLRVTLRPTLPSDPTCCTKLTAD